MDTVSLASEYLSGQHLQPVGSFSCPSVRQSPLVELVWIHAPTILDEDAQYPDRFVTVIVCNKVISGIDEVRQALHGLKHYGVGDCGLVQRRTAQ